MNSWENQGLITPLAASTPDLQSLTFTISSFVIDGYVFQNLPETVHPACFSRSVDRIDSIQESLKLVGFPFPAA